MDGHRLTPDGVQARQLTKEERGQLARDITMDDADRSFREMQLANLPGSTAAAVSELGSYDWQSPEARETFRFSWKEKKRRDEFLKRFWSSGVRPVRLESAARG